MVHQTQQSHYCYPISLCVSVFKGNYHHKIGKRFYCNTLQKHWILAHVLNNVLPHDESLPEQNNWKIVKVSELTVSGWAEINGGPGYATRTTVTAHKGELLAGCTFEIMQMILQMTQSNLCLKGIYIFT